LEPGRSHETYRYKYDDLLDEVRFYDPEFTAAQVAGAFFAFVSRSSSAMAAPLVHGCELKAIPEPSDTPDASGCQMPPWT
jgi:hypothetical protein